MSKRVKIYINFISCFIVCMILYLFSTYFQDFIQQILQAQSLCWQVEFSIVILASLINGAILEYFNKAILKQPEKIFCMLKYLILQLYLFSIILFYIVMVSDSLLHSKNFLTENILFLNLFIFCAYIFYIWYDRNKRLQKFKRVDIIKIIICASLIFQSSVIEIIFLGIYLLLLYFITRVNYLNSPKIKLLFSGTILVILLIEIYLWISPMNNIYSKIFFNVTNIFIFYVGINDWIFLKKRKE